MGTRVRMSMAAQSLKGHVYRRNPELGTTMRVTVPGTPDRHLLPCHHSRPLSREPLSHSLHCWASLSPALSPHSPHHLPWGIMRNCVCNPQRRSDRLPISGLLCLQPMGATENSKHYINSTHKNSRTEARTFTPNFPPRL